MQGKLSKKQKIKLNKMVQNYMWGVARAHNASPSLIKSWASRYRAIMECHLLKQNKGTKL